MLGPITRNKAIAYVCAFLLIFLGALIATVATFLPGWVGVAMLIFGLVAALLIYPY